LLSRLLNTFSSFNKPAFALETYSIAGKKPVNEDSLLAVQKKHVALVLVADGVGGHGHGDWASRLCVEQYGLAFEKIDNLNDPEAFLKENAWTVARQVLQKGQDDPAYQNCGTTLTGFLVVEDAYYTINIGDSRTYLYNEKKGLKRLTKDHSMVQEMIDAGTLTEEEALTHPYRARMTSAIGQPLDKIKMDVKGPYTLGASDRLLSFSDGVHDYLTDAQILQIIQSTPENLARELVQKALGVGSHDNITACLLMVKT
jgi:protein phosphatase